MRIARIGLLAAIVAVTGCAKKIDVSNDAAFQRSIDAIRQDLDAERRGRFDEAIALIGLASRDLGELVRVDPTMRSAVDGLTADQVIAKAEDIRIKRAAVERAQARAEIGQLEVKRAAAERDRRELRAFVVLRCGLRMKNVGFLRMPLVELTLHNGTDNSVAEAHFHGLLTAPGRTLPATEQDFSYSIPGGMRPSETKHVALRPSFAWDNLRVPSGAIFIATVVRIDGPDGKPIYDAAQFGPEEAERLADLRKKLAREAGQG